MHRHIIFVLNKSKILMRLKKSSGDMNAAMAADATTDEVDGLAKDLILPISKMVFLKIILFDIGISLGKSIPRSLKIFIFFSFHLFYYIGK